MEAILAIDPGFHLGWIKILFDPDKMTTLLQGGGTVVGLDEVNAWIDESSADKYVVEDYLIRPANLRKNDNRRRYEHIWDDGTTLRIIGQIQARARNLGAEFILQQPSIKPAGYGFAGKPYKPGAKGVHVHQDDAIAHLVWYLVRKRKAPPDILKRRGLEQPA